MENANLVYLWPVYWMHYLSRGMGLNIIFIFTLLSATLALALPNFRIIRVAVAYFYLCQVSVDYAEGNVGHASHATLWIVIILALIPTWRSRQHYRIERQRVLNYFFFGQVLVAFFYFCSGLWKIGTAITQFAMGEHNAFQFDAVSRILAERLLVGYDHNAGPFFISHPILGWLGFWALLMWNLRY